MKQKVLIIILALISVVVVGNTVLLVNSYQQSKRTVVIDVIRVFNEFKLKKDLEGRVAVKLNEYKSSIDSLNAVYHSLAQKNAGNEVLMGVAVDIDTLRTRAQRAYQISDRNINEQVWQRLNTLLTEYGEKFDYSLVIGANGMGTVLFNKKGLEKTDELIKFINENMKAAIRIILLIALVSSGSCSNKNPKELSGRNYIAYVESEKSKLHTHIRSGIWSYDIQYKPTAYVALKEQDPTHLNKSTVADRIRSLEKTVWFNVTIRVNDKSLDPLKYGAAGLEEYNGRLDYFLNKAGQNFHLKYGNSAMKRIGYLFENNYNIKPEVVAVVGFSIPDSLPTQGISLEYYDELFNAGIIKFGIRAEDLTRIPALSI